MLKIPHTNFHFKPNTIFQPGVIDAFLAVEPAVPGCTVYVVQPGFSMKVLRRVTNLVDVPPAKLFIQVPYHAEACFDIWLNRPDNGLVRSCAMINIDDNGKRRIAKSRHGDSPGAIDSDAFIAKGRCEVSPLIASSKFHDYQFAPVHAARAGHRFFLLRSDGGSGKSPMLMATAIEMGARRVLVLVLGATRNLYTGWPAMCARWCPGARYYVGLSKSDPMSQKQPNPDLLAMGDGFAFIAYESAADYYDIIRKWRPDFVGFDEIHKQSNSRRVKGVITDGDLSWTARTTAVKGNDTRAKVLADIANLPSVKGVISLTATHFVDGQPENMYAPLDLTMPWAFGTGRNFRLRHQNGPCLADGDNPGFDKHTPSHVDELKKRLKYVVLDIPSSVTKPHIKRCNVVFTRVQPEQQGNDRGYGFNAAIKKLTKAGNQTSLHELRLAQDCARLWPYIEATLKERLAAGQRCIVFATRNEILEAWAEKARRLFPKAWVGCIHGEVAKADDILADYAVRIPFETPAVLFANRLLVGTGSNGLEETHWACDASPSSNPSTLAQLKFRFERPKPRLDASTILEELICVGGYSESKLSKTVENLEAAARLTDSGDVDDLLSKAAEAGFDSKTLEEAQSDMADAFMDSINSGLDDY